ncbi:hypothetical protein [Marinomonas transparens]|uniref:hypothetical protein n=1 Tax=Marinomonas transparens TaxID=2795388 RepID=UPI001F27ED30|nr:hypothetical protein [Marinomonas transparens]
MAKGQLEQIRESARGIEYWRLLSLYWLSIDHIEQALLIHKEALIEFPDDDFLLNNYGVLLGQKEHWKEACESFKKAYQNGVSKRQSVSVNLSRCAIRQNDVNLAKIYLKQAKEIDDLPLIGLMTELNLVLIQGNKDKARLIFNNIQANEKNVRKSGYFDEYNCLSRHLTAREIDPTLYPSASNFTCLNNSRY